MFLFWVSYLESAKVHNYSNQLRLLMKFRLFVQRYIFSSVPLSLNFSAISRFRPRSRMTGRPPRPVGREICGRPLSGRNPGCSRESRRFSLFREGHVPLAREGVPSRPPRTCREGQCVWCCLSLAWDWLMFLPRRYTFLGEKL